VAAAVAAAESKDASIWLVEYFRGELDLIL
jgi:hypothetical protein